MAATSPELDVTLERIREFPEWLPPVVVKELRQGLRSGLFVLPFSLLPAVLAGAAVWAITINNLASARLTVNVFFWAALAIPVAVLTPLRALNAIRREQANNTYDLLQLTPLTGWRIVTGKWYSLLAQAGLWIVALLPFLVLRYFFGGMDVVAELLTVLWTLVVGAALTSVGLFISTFRQPLIGAIATIVACLFALFTVVPMLGIFAQGMFGRGSTGSTVVLIVGQIFMLLITAGITGFSLALTVSRVAPPPPYHPRYVAPVARPPA